MILPIDRFKGALLGLAVGDALGTALEFTRPNSFVPVSEILGGGPFNLKAGQWTDDTSMALCLAESLIECKGFDARDQMERYVRWYREGHWSSTGRCFDIGNATANALCRFEKEGNPYAGSTASTSAGNGSIMRLVPVVLASSANAEEAIRLAAESSKTTHGAEDCLHACRLMAAIILGALQGSPKSEILSDGFSPVDELWNVSPLSPNIQNISSGSFREKEPPEIRGTGWVVQSLEAALWAFHSTESFKDGALKAVNLGEDADTTGAVYGQIAGAFYGIDGIPKEWTTVIHRGNEILGLAEDLFSLSQGESDD